MGKLTFTYGTMNSGKSTAAIQMNQAFKANQKKGLIITMGDRSGEDKVTARNDLECAAIPVAPNENLFFLIEEKIINEKLDYVICDEVQFCSETEIEQLICIVDLYDLDVYCFGLLTDFRGQLFPAAKKLIEMADEKNEIKTHVLCWCGRKAIMNARVRDGYVSFAGDTIQIGDVGENSYEMLCRKDYLGRFTRRVAMESGLISDDSTGSKLCLGSDMNNGE